MDSLSADGDSRKWELPGNRFRAFGGQQNYLELNSDGKYITL